MALLSFVGTWKFEEQSSGMEELLKAQGKAFLMLRNNICFTLVFILDLYPI